MSDPIVFSDWPPRQKLSTHIVVVHASGCSRVVVYYIVVVVDNF